MKHLLKLFPLALTFFLISNVAQSQIYSIGNTLSTTGSAIGGYNTSNGYMSTAIARNAQATTTYAVAVGYGVKATGLYSSSFGFLSESTGYNSFSFGNRSKSTGSQSYSFGVEALSSGTFTFAIGWYAKATANNSVSIGNYSETTGANSFAFGENVKTSAINNMTIGRGISTSVKLNNDSANSLMIGFNSNIPTFFIGASSGSGTTGNVGIGTTNTNGYKLAVKGNVIAEEIVVKLYASWPDYVFGEKYGLKSLSEVERYIQKYNHLPDVPSESEVKDEGINLAEMDAILLQKIEELTLYTIEQQKLIEKQGKLIEELSKGQQ